MIFNKTFIEEQVIKLTDEMKMKEVFLKFAKEQEVRQSLIEDIYKLSLQRDIYLSFYEFDKVKEEMEEKEGEESE